MDQLRTSFPFLEQLSEQEIVDAARTAIETSLRDKTDILHLRMNDYLIRMEQLCGIFGIMRTKTKLAELSFEKILLYLVPDPVALPEVDNLSRVIEIAVIIIMSDKTIPAII